MNVFTLYTAAQAPALRLWARSWKKNGYTPKLITAREVIEYRGIRRTIRKRGGGIFVVPGAFNVSHRRGKPSVRKFGARGWQKAAVVLFPAGTEERTILGVLNVA